MSADNPVSLPPQRSDETRWVDVKCAACGTGNSRLPGSDLWYCGACGEPLPAGARSGAGAEAIDGEMLDTAECSACPNRGRCTHVRCILRERNHHAAELTTLRAQLAEARERLNPERLCQLANLLEKWADGRGRYAMPVDAMRRDAKHLRALAAAHPTEENRS